VTKPTLTVSLVANVSTRQRATRVYFSGDAPMPHLLKRLAPAILSAIGIPTETAVKWRTVTSKDGHKDCFLEMLADMALPQTFQVEGASEVIAASFAAGGVEGFRAKLAAS
jgi:hypothetical protein